MIATQTFIMSFLYGRQRYIGGVLVPMDQESASLKDNQVVDIEVLDEKGTLVTIISLRQENTLYQLHMDMHEESPHILPMDFFFVHNGKHVMKR